MMYHVYQDVWEEVFDMNAVTSNGWYHNVVYKIREVQPDIGLIIEDELYEKLP